MKQCNCLSTSVLRAHRHRTRRPDRLRSFHLFRGPSKANSVLRNLKPITCSTYTPNLSTKSSQRAFSENVGILGEFRFSILKLFRWPISFEKAQALHKLPAAACQDTWSHDGSCHATCLVSACKACWDWRSRLLLIDLLNGCMASKLSVQKWLNHTNHTKPLIERPRWRQARLRQKRELFLHFLPSSKWPTNAYSDLPLHFSNKVLERGKVECRLPLLLCLLHGGRDALVTLRLTAHHGLSAWP